MTSKELKQAIKNAPKYFLQASNGLYLAATQGLCGVNLTSNKAEAMEYAHGFDNVETAVSIWNAQSKVSLGQSLNFQVV